MYPSVLAISTPFKRPDTEVLIPFAPAFIALLIANFCANLKLPRFSNLTAIPSASNLAFKSGFFNSITSIAIFKFLFFSSFLRANVNALMLSPFVPNNAAGLAVKT
ncbi:Uncharacterised protein [Chlamydia trachomatis]|nr:Uncharacterised protein [Chlamydia trachomatis]